MQNDRRWNIGHGYYPDLFRPITEKALGRQRVDEDGRGRDSGETRRVFTPDW